MSTKRPSKWRAAWTAGRLAGRRVLGREAGERDLALGERLTGQLDKMKGLPMKLGQIVSYMDVPLPEPVLADLARLQTGEHGLPPDDTRAALESALGAPVEACFEQFEWTPVAAASIGQVHRAVVGGVPVAVKLQYPGIADTFTSDLGLVRRLARIASLATAVDVAALVRELEQRLREECDYAREADMQCRFAAAFAGDPGVRIPRVIDRLSGPAVLTSEWAPGRSFEALRASGDRREIDAAAEVLVRFSYRSLLELALIQADPHPGNFLFDAGGDVTFLDFGCVRHLDIELVEALRATIAAVRDGDRARFRDATVALGVVGRPKKFDFDHYYAVNQHVYRPLIEPRFRFTAEYVAEGLALNGPASPNGRAIALPPALIWVMRLQWGLWSILARLGAEGSYRPVLDQLLARPLAAAPPADQAHAGVA